MAQRARQRGSCIAVVIADLAGGRQHRDFAGHDGRTGNRGVRKRIVFFLQKSVRVRSASPHQAVTLLPDRSDGFGIDLRINDFVIVLTAANDDFAFGIDDLTKARIRQALLLSRLIRTDKPQLILVASGGLVNLVLFVRGRVGDVANDFGALQSEYSGTFGNSCIGAYEKPDLADRRVEHGVACRTEGEIEGVEVEQEVFLVLADQPVRPDQSYRIIYVASIALRQADGDIDRQLLAKLADGISKLSGDRVGDRQRVGFIGPDVSRIHALRKDHERRAVFCGFQNVFLHRSQVPLGFSEVRIRLNCRNLELCHRPIFLVYINYSVRQDTLCQVSKFLAD